MSCEHQVVYVLFNNSEFYVGSTGNIKDRIIKHKCNKTLTGIFQYELLEEFPDQITKDELLEEETRWFLIAKNYESDNFKLLNKVYPKRSKKEYFAANKELIYAKKYTRVICDCGKETDKNHIKRHQRTKEHLRIVLQSEA